jgi:predicted DNA-binding transcriptional regulator YafY
LLALEILISHPVITAARLAARLDISVRAALTGVEQLREAGILQERTGYRRNRVFCAPEILTIINRPFGTPPAIGAEE